MNNNQLIKFIEENIKEFERNSTYFYEAIYKCNLKLEAFINDPRISNLISLFTKSTPTTFKTNAINIINKLKEIDAKSSEIDLNEINKRVIENSFPLSYWEGKDIPYEKRKQAFEQYIQNYVKLYKSTNRDDFVNLIQRIPHYFGMCVCEKYKNISENYIIIVYNCCCKGEQSTKRQTKGRNCKFECRLEFDYNGFCHIEYTLHGKSDFSDNFDHSHEMSIQFVKSVGSNLTLKQISDIKKEIKDVGGIKKFRELHPNHGIEKRFLSRYAKETDSYKPQEVEFLVEYKLSDGIFIRIDNKFSDGTLHSMSFINIKIANSYFSRHLWIIDDTSLTNIYNKRLLGIVVKDDYNYSQVLCFGLLFDGSIESFEILFSNIKQVLCYGPDIVLSDRNKSQIKALTNVFGDVSIFYCIIHIDRNLKTYFKGDNVILKSFKLMTQGRLHEEDMERIWKAYIYNNAKERDKDIIEVDDLILKSIKNKTKTDDIFYNCYDYYDYVSYDRESIEYKNMVKNMISEAEKINYINGKECLSLLIIEKEHWYRSFAVKKALYKDVTTNAIENVWGDLKAKINHKKLPLFKLIEEMENISMERMERVYFCNVPKKYFDLNDPKIKELKPIASVIISEQLSLYESNKFNESGIGCLSCQIFHSSNEGKNVCFPCVHQLKKIIEENNGKIDPSLFPERCFIMRERNTLNYCECGEKSLKIPPGTFVLNRIRYKKAKHNTNRKQRLTVDQRANRSIIKNATLDSSIGDDYQRQLGSKVFIHEETSKTGYISLADVDIRFSKLGSSQDIDEIIKERREEIKEDNQQIDVDKMIEIDDVEKENDKQMNIINVDEISEDKNMHNNVNNVNIMSEDEQLSKDENDVSNQEIVTEKETDKSEEIELYNENIIENINRIITKENYYIISPNVHKSLIEHSYNDFWSYVSLPSKWEKIFIPLKVDEVWFILCICKSFSINRKIRRNCVISIQCSKELNNKNIIEKAIDYLKEKPRSNIKDHSIIYVKNHKLIFKNDQNFISFLTELTSSNFSSRNDIQSILDNTKK